VIKVVVGFRLKIGVDIQPTLLKLRSYAMTFPGFVSGENLVSVKDDTIYAILYAWENIENWKAWESTKVRSPILKEAESLLREQPRITIYQVMPTTGWTYSRLNS
jgi:antibiotic biosynthesis monooxygenase (ABM) superfamily enzyme